MWQGEHDFGDYFFAYCGPAGDNARHSHATLQVSWGFGDALRIETPSGLLVHSDPIFIRPGTPHRLLPAGRILLILIEPQSAVAQHILAELGPDSYAVRRDIFDPAPFLQADLSTAMSTLAALASARVLQIDERLEQALSFLRTAPLKAAVSVAARQVGLSESRLRALAHASLGIPLSKWLLWVAVGRAAGALRQGASLAEAAISGGFSDQSHYSRTLKRLTGILPSTAKNLLQ